MAGKKSKGKAKYKTNPARALKNQERKLKREADRLERKRLRLIARYNAGKPRSKKVPQMRRVAGGRTIQVGWKVEAKKNKNGEVVRQGFAEGSPRDEALKAHIAKIRATKASDKK